MTVKSFIANNLVEFSKKSKILEKKEEFYHIEQWREKRQSKSLQIILNSYLRLAVSYARKYKSYGLPLDDLIHEGVLGIMHALEKFDISKDFRLSTYASWWIRASIQDYILKNWSVVKTGSTASQKALFFNLRKIKQQISDASSDFMGQKEINKVSEMLNVKTFEIQNMESRLSGGDVFLNQKIDNDSENDLMSLLEDDRANPEESFENFNDGKIKKDYLVFLESFFRKSFHLVGTPIKVLLKNSDNPFDKQELRPKKTGLVTRRKIKNEYRAKLKKKNSLD